MRIGLVFFLIGLGLWESRAVSGQDQTGAFQNAEGEVKGKKLLNLKVPTLGGKQLWADELFFHQWRIQRNTITNHCRLLDGNNIRQAWGTFAQCQVALRKIRREKKLPPMKGKAVILLHGLFRSRSSMNGLAKYLQKNDSYTVFNFGYPTTRAGIGSHAASLARVIENLDGIEEINLVAHSLGNLVVRRYLADQTDQQHRPDPRLRRFVMLGPPNGGAQLAARFGQNKFFELIVGDSGRELGLGWSEIEKHLATPRFQFGIIAGGLASKKVSNPLLVGDDDLVVSIEEARLPGAHDFLVLPVMHSFIMDSKKSRKATLSFLQHGYFISEERRQPIVEP